MEPNKVYTPKSTNYGGYDITEDWRLENNPTYTGGNGDIFYNTKDPNQAVKVQRGGEAYSDIYQFLSQYGTKQVSGETAYAGTGKDLLSLEDQAEKQRLADLSNQITQGKLSVDEATKLANDSALKKTTIPQKENSNNTNTGSASSVAQKKAANSRTRGEAGGQLEAGTVAPTPFFGGANLANGSRGPAVQQLQTALGIKADGIFGNQTLAAVKQFQLKNGLKVDGIVGPQTMAALNAPTGSPIQSVDTGMRNPKPIIEEVEEALPTTGNPTIDALLQQLTKASPQRTFEEIYKQVTRDSGISTMRKDYENQTKEFTNLQEKKNDEVQNINNDPWLSEGVRVQKLRQLDSKYEGKELILTNKLKLLESNMQSAREDIQFQTGQIMSQANKAAELDQNIILKAIEIAENQMDAEDKLQDTTDLKEYNFAKSEGYIGTFTQYQKEQANLKERIARAGASNTYLPNGQDVTTKETAEALGTVNSISNILTDPNFESAFGPAGLVNTLIPGTAAYTLNAQIRQVKDKLALAARGQLKGQGQVSNFEGLMLQNAQTSLRTGMTPASARQEFINIAGALTTSTGGQAKVQLKDSNGAIYTIMADSRGITKAIADGLQVKYIQ